MDYARLQATALRLITNAGQAMTLRHLTPGEYADGVAAVAVSEEAVRGVLVAYSDYAQANELVEANDSRILVAASGIAEPPKEADEIVDAAGTAYRIVRVGSVNPAGTPLVYDLQVRG